LQQEPVILVLEEHLRRLAGVARTLIDAGLIVVVPAAASLADSAPWALELFEDGELVEYRLEGNGEAVEDSAKFVEEIASGLIG
jgi:adenylylsulfate kinase-like enzyme